MLDKFFKKEKPIQGLAGMGGGIASKLFGGGASFAARGGQFYNPGDGYFYHMFEGAGVHSFVAEGGGTDIDIFITGAGGGRGSGGAGPSDTPGPNKTDTGGGGGGSVQGLGYAITAGTYTIQLGGAGFGVYPSSSVPTSGGYNGGSASGVSLPSPNNPSNPGKGGGGGGGFSQFYQGGTVIAAGGGGGAGGARGSTGTGGGHPSNPGYRPDSTTGETGFTDPSPGPGGGTGGGGSGGGVDGSGGGGGLQSQKGGQNYASPQFSSSTLYYGNSSTAFGKHPSGQVSGLFMPTASPASPQAPLRRTHWIPQEPTNSGGGANSTMIESAPSRRGANGGYAIIRYAATPSVSPFTQPGLISNVQPFIPGNGSEYFAITSSQNVTLPAPATFEVLVVGAGGGAGCYHNSPQQYGYNTTGGGGGAVVIQTVTVNAGTYPIVVGDGVTNPHPNNGTGTISAGEDSSAFGVTAPGGSAGPTNTSNPAPGGSPGGGSGSHQANGGDGTLCPNYHPAYFGITDSDGEMRVRGTPQNIPGGAYYGGGGAGNRQVNSPPPSGLNTGYTGGQGGGGDTKGDMNYNYGTPVAPLGGPPEGRTGATNYGGGAAAPISGYYGGGYPYSYFYDKVFGNVGGAPGIVVIRKVLS